MPTLPDDDTLTTFNDFMPLVLKLDLDPLHIISYETKGIWFLTIHPGFNVAVPTDRQSDIHPEYVEGGRTKSGLKEFVLTNDIDFLGELKARNIKLYRIAGKESAFPGETVPGETVEYRAYFDNERRETSIIPYFEWRERSRERRAFPNQV